MARSQSLVQITAKYERVTEDSIGLRKIRIEINGALRNHAGFFGISGHVQNESQGVIGLWARWRQSACFLGKLPRHIERLASRPNPATPAYMSMT